MKIESIDLFNYGKRSENVKHAQLCMRCSKLNVHLFALHVVESSACNCGSLYEDNNHYLIIIILSIISYRKTYMKRNISNIMGNEAMITVDLLLFGSHLFNLKTNCAIFREVHAFIRDTARI